MTWRLLAWCGIAVAALVPIIGGIWLFTLPAASAFRVPPPIASLPGQIDTLGHEWYDFASKYDDGGMELLVPPPGLPPPRQASGRSPRSS